MSGEAVRHSAAAGLKVAGGLGHAVRDGFMNGFTSATAVAAAVLVAAALGAFLRAPSRARIGGPRQASSARDRAAAGSAKP